MSGGFFDVGPSWPHLMPCRLFSAAAAVGGGGGSLAGFYAAVATDADAFRTALAERFGETVARRTRIVVGFDADDRLAQGLLGPSTVRMLRWAARHPGSPLVDGLEVQHSLVVGSSEVWPAA